MEESQKPSERMVRKAVILIIIIGILVEILISANRIESSFASPVIRALNFFVFFTAWTNILIAFMQKQQLSDRKLSDLSKGLAVAGLGSGPLVFIIHRLYLAGPLSGYALVSDVIVHVLAPVCVVIVWLKFGPKGLFNLKTVLLSLLFPTVWILFTFTRGYLTGWYPYEFIDPDIQEWSTVVQNIISLYGFMYIWICCFWILDRKRQK
jgi:hypothetical protein